MTSQKSNPVESTSSTPDVPLVEGIRITRFDGGFLSTAEPESLDVHLESASRFTREECNTIFGNGVRGLYPLWFGPRCNLELNKSRGNGKQHPAEPIRIGVVLKYPLHYTWYVSVPLEGCEAGIGIGDIIYAICQAYRVIYADHEKYGVYGHRFSDLYLEELLIDEENLMVQPRCGS